MYIIYPIEIPLLIAAFVILGLLGMDMTAIAWIAAIIVTITTVLGWFFMFVLADESSASDILCSIFMNILMSHMSFHLIKLLLTTPQIHGIDLLRGLLWLFWPV